MSRIVHPNGQLHTDVYCPKCGAEMTDLEFEIQDRRSDVLWKSYWKCSKCGTKIKW